jgi:hypothetical protein
MFCHNAIQFGSGSRAKSTRTRNAGGADYKTPGERKWFQEIAPGERFPVPPYCRELRMTAGWLRAELVIIIVILIVIGLEASREDYDYDYDVDYDQRLIAAVKATG